MKTQNVVAAIILAMVVILGIVAVCSAAPWLVCDPQTGVTSYQITGPAWSPTTLPAQADGSLRMDVATATVGNSAMTFKACNVDPLWGTVCSTATPFVLTRPDLSTVAPSNLRLVP
jgi:hypothetical protein